MRDDARWLASAARLGLRGRPSSHPNPNVGALVVRDGKVTGRGWTQPGGRPHAEAMALAEAGEAARGGTLYSTLEPCAHPSERGPTCAQLIADAGLARCVFALTDPDARTAGKGADMLRAARVQVDMLDCAAARDSLSGYLMRKQHGRPHVTLKLAVSLDGRIAMADGASRWITGDAARAHVHSRRAMADAILVGGGTWRADAPRLDVRLPGLEDRSPARVVLSRGAALDGTSAIASPADIATLDAHYLYVEGGAGTAAAFLSADLVDRIDLYRAPVVIGAGASAIGDIGLADLADAHGRWTRVEHRMLGVDDYTAYRCNRTHA